MTESPLGRSRAFRFLYGLSWVGLALGVLLRMISLPPQGLEVLGYLILSLGFLQAFRLGPRRAPRLLAHLAGAYFFLEVLRGMARGVPPQDFLILGPWLPALYVLAAFAYPLERALGVALLWTFSLFVPLGFFFLRGAPSLYPAFFSVLVGEITVGTLILLLARFREFYGQARFWQTEALTDPLTRLPNRRAFQMALDREISRFERYGVPFSLALMDLDRFKALNDAYGHEYGDAILRKAARFLVDHLRREDLVARWGGEEFALLLASSSLEETRHLLERIREGLKHAVGVTASFGAAEYRAGETKEELFRRANHALYRAKEGGRDRVELA